jgi:hypothetical protein
LPRGVTDGRTRNIMSGLEWRNKANEYKSQIKIAKQKTWREFVEEADERTIWTVKKYIDSTPTQAYIPTLNDTATSNEAKAAQFQSTFFPPAPQANTSDINDNLDYPTPVQCPTEVTIQQLESAIYKLAPDKAPGPDEITNRVLKRNFHVIGHHLLALLQASINTGHFPLPFKKTITIVLCKPNKPDYTKPKAYRPIALESTL